MENWIWLMSRGALAIAIIVVLVVAILRPILKPLPARTTGKNESVSPALLPSEIPTAGAVASAITPEPATAPAVSSAKSETLAPRRPGLVGLYVRMPMGVNAPSEQVDLEIGLERDDGLFGAWVLCDHIIDPFSWKIGSSTARARESQAIERCKHLWAFLHAERQKPAWPVDKSCG